jgi:hypothetical protein
MPQLRYTDFAESNKKNVFGDNIENLISGNSYVNIQLYIIDHFNTENIWYGRSYIDLFYAWLPRSVFTDKPPVDDGMYIVNHYYGYFFQPSTPIRLMIQTSWPPGTMGIGYINFHFIGIILAYFILGRLMKMGYLIFTKMRYSPLILFFYSFLVVKFQLTNFYIFYTISYVFLLIVLSIMIKLFIKMRQKL